MKKQAKKIAERAIGLIFFLAMVPVVVIHHIIVVAKLPRSVDKLITKVYAILDAMTDNAWFPNPSPALSDVRSKNDDLKNAQVLAKSKAPGSIQDRNVKKSIVVNAVYALRDYCQSICDAHPESAEAIAFSGLFGVKKVSGRPKRTFKVKRTTSGCVELSASLLGFHCAHEWGMSLNYNDPASWYAIPITPTLKATTIVENLTPCTRVYFRHRIITTDGATDWDQIINIVVD